MANYLNVERFGTQHQVIYSYCLLFFLFLCFLFDTQHQVLYLAYCCCSCLFWHNAPGDMHCLLFLFCSLCFCLAASTRCHICLLLLFLPVFDIVAFVFFKFLFGKKQPGDIYYCCCCCFLLLFLFCFSCFCLAPSTRCHILLVVVVLLFGTHGTKCYCVKHILLTLEPK